MQKLRTFLWKSPDYDKPIAKMTYDPDKDEYHVYIYMDVPDTVNAGMISFYRFYRHLTELDARESMIFVRSRVIPPDRQGLDSILKDMNLKEYSEIGILTYFHGKCTKDHIYMEEIFDSE